MKCTVSIFSWSQARIVYAWFRAKLLAFLVLYILSTHSDFAQGTTVFTFEGQSPGTTAQANPSAFGLGFRAIPFGFLDLSGGGVAGYPDNGTGYLFKPDGSLFGMRFESTNSLSAIIFDLVSFDAAEYVGPPTALTVVGYRFQIMAPIIAVTNIFTLDGINDGTGPIQDFQTFYLDSGFANVFRVDVLGGSWAIDNWTISGVPEPSSGALALLGILSAIGWSSMRRKRLSQRYDRKNTKR